ncbi:Spo0B domain-containing protein [Enterococcus xiangfangensis]|uniref:Spo0B domain-containing protein n=1 Tax=Enterococcus xiangfangensis TaxID=1296537 RepID=UPI0010F44AC5|nr:sensor histidine kinase [Enterococcus xiangfangensis]MBM7711101.1 two-component system CitB family sensor kinase [Enterococcus xiangfangensis]NBK07726.1 sensor histidine kinase [Enterococcus asini]
MKKGLRLWALLSIIFVSTLLITNTILYGVILYQDAKTVQKREEKLLLDLGKQLALEPEIQQTLLANNYSENTEQYTLAVTRIHQLDFIVLMDMQGIRLTHPDKTKIGKSFEGGDEKKALHGESHVSISDGTLGRSLRGFVPVHAQGKQIGVVALGITLDSLSKLVTNSRQQYTLALLISIGVGLLVASIAAYYLKKQLLNLEPKEISRLLTERNVMLDETKDIVVVIDSDETINLANIAAIDMYHRLSGNTDSLTGQKIDQLLLDKKQVDFTRSVQQLYRQNGQDYLFSSAPILVHQKQIGSILFLRNATESLFVTDQLVNTTAYASALQSQSHEFMNKLHIIYGLVDLENYNELKIYLNDILQPEKEFSHRLAVLVKNPIIAGFFIGEREKFAERKTQLFIEISPELPNTTDQNQTTNLINVYRYIHHALLQRYLPDEVTMKIEYFDQRLKTRYHFQLNEAEAENLELAFAENYFTQLVADCNGTFQLTINEAILMDLETDYKEN